MDRSPQTKALIAVVALALLAAGPAAVADDAEEEARKLFQEGVRLYQDGYYAKASIAFERAYEIKPSYKILFNIAQTENQLEHYAAALRLYRLYLTEGGERVPDERRELAEAEIERLGSLVGTIFVECPVEGAKIKVNAVVVGRSPWEEPIIVDMGQHEVMVVDGVDELLRERIKVGGGESVTVVVETAAPEPGPETATVEEGPERVWTWVALGTGAAALIAGGVLGGAGMTRTADLKQDCAGNHCPSSSQGEIDTIKRMNLAADVLFGVGGALVITGVVLFFAEPDDDEEELALTPAALGDGAGLTVRGSF